MLNKDGLTPYMTKMKDVWPKILEEFINGWQRGMVTLVGHHLKLDIKQSAFDYGPKTYRYDFLPK